MKKIDVIKLRNDIVEGMRLSSEKLKALKKQLGRSVVIIENGVVKEIQKIKKSRNIANTRFI